MTKNRLFSSPVWKIFFSGIAIILAGLSISCREEKIDPLPAEPTQTLLMYMPWSGPSQPLTSYFLINVADMEEAISAGILDKERVLVFLATSPTRASLFELKYDRKKGECVQKTVKEYENHPYTTATGIATILNDMKRTAPANRYSMSIGGHGMGWLPVSKKTESSSPKASTSHSTPFRYHWETTDGPLTRFFGGSSADYQTEITTLAEGIRQAGITMEYILFDDCYMSCVELAYDLRHVTRHLIASTSEVMAYGMPYRDMAIHMLGNIDYEGISQSFYDFYSSYSTPCGTIAMTVTEELDSLASLMREINTKYQWDTAKNSTLQKLDGYSPTIYYDLRDYVTRLCEDSILLDKFNEQLEKAVPSASRAHTLTFYSALNGRRTAIHSFSGLTISDPSTDTSHHVSDTKSQTAWFKATHLTDNEED